MKRWEPVLSLLEDEGAGSEKQILSTAPPRDGPPSKQKKRASPLARNEEDDGERRTPFQIQLKPCRNLLGSCGAKRGVVANKIGTDQGH